MTERRTDGVEHFIYPIQVYFGHQATNQQ